MYSIQGGLSFPGHTCLEGLVKLNVGVTGPPRKTKMKEKGVSFMQSISHVCLSLVELFIF